MLRSLEDRIEAGEFDYNDIAEYKDDAFFSAALEETGLTNHPNAREIMLYAWRKGHSGGLLNVLLELNTISQLFFKISLDDLEASLQEEFIALKERMDNAYDILDDGKERYVDLGLDKLESYTRSFTLNLFARLGILLS